MLQPKKDSTSHSQVNKTVVLDGSSGQ